LLPRPAAPHTLPRRDALPIYRFNQHLQSLAAREPGGDSLAARLAAEAARYREAYAMQYGEIFAITALLCVAGALLGLLIAGHGEIGRAHVWTPVTGTTRMPAA